MGKKVILASLLLTCALFAEFNRSSVLIDIPTAYVLRHNVVQGTVVGSYMLQPVTNVPTYDVDVAVGIGLGNFLELSLSAYTLQHYSLGITAMVLKEQEYTPSIALGIHDITWYPYIGSFGGGRNTPPGDNDPENRVIAGKPGFLYWEQREFFSAFAVASKQLGDYFRCHVGIGRGRYTGYDNFSRNFNTDIANNTAVSEFALGLFGGLEFNYQGWLSIAGEFDGRDLNFGTKLGFENFEIYLAMTRLENLAPASQYSPRLVAGFNLYTTPHSRNTKGTNIIGNVFYPDGSPAVQTKVEAFTESYNQQVSTLDKGAYKLRAVPAGKVTIVASAEGFRSRPKDLMLKTNSHSPINVNLSLIDIRNKGSIKGAVRDAEDGSGIIANVYVLENGDVFRAGPRGGSYEILGLDPRKYTLHAEAKGYFDRDITFQAVERRSVNLDINMKKTWIIFHFKPGEKMIEPRYVPVLEDVVMFLKNRPNVIVEVQGHTDSVGDAKENRKLSRKRAAAVRDYLVKRGISPKRLIVKGYGELAPIGDNRTVLGRDMNRRVELKIVAE